MEECKLISRLFDAWRSKENVPDFLSREYRSSNGDWLVIRFEWFNGKIKDFGYTRERFNCAWNLLDDYRDSQKHLKPSNQGLINQHGLL